MNNSPVRFLDLPRELRDRIYQLSLTSDFWVTVGFDTSAQASSLDTPVQHTTFSQASSEYVDAEPVILRFRLRVPVSLLLLSKQVSAEAKEMISLVKVTARESLQAGRIKDIPGSFFRDTLSNSRLILDTKLRTAIAFLERLPPPVLTHLTHVVLPENAVYDVPYRIWPQQELDLIIRCVDFLRHQLPNLCEVSLYVHPSSDVRGRYCALPLKVFREALAQGDIETLRLLYAAIDRNPRPNCTYLRSMVGFLQGDDDDERNSQLGPGEEVEPEVFEASLEVVDELDPERGEREWKWLGIGTVVKVKRWDEKAKGIKMRKKYLNILLAGKG